MSPDARACGCLLYLESSCKSFFDIEPDSDVETEADEEANTTADNEASDIKLGFGSVKSGYFLYSTVL